jgi:hypothetical protein
MFGSELFGLIGISRRKKFETNKYGKTKRASHAAISLQMRVTYLQVCLSISGNARDSSAGGSRHHKT